MGITASTSLGQLGENQVARRFVAATPIAKDDPFWRSFLAFTFEPPEQPAAHEAFDTACRPLFNELVKNNLSSLNLHTLVAVTFKNAEALQNDENCNSNQPTLLVRNGLFILRSCVRHLLFTQSESSLLRHLVGSCDQSRDSTHRPAPMTGMDEAYSQFIVGMAKILVDVSQTPFTYSVHLECVHLLLTLFAAQMLSDDMGCAAIEAAMSVPKELAARVVSVILHLFISQPPSPPPSLRLPSPGVIYSITSGLFSMVMPRRAPPTEPSPLPTHSLLLLLLLAHQHSHGTNPFRDSISSFSDERSVKTEPSFCISLEKLYTAVCKELQNDYTTLFLYQLLQGNPQFASFTFSRSDIDAVVVPLLEQLCRQGVDPTHRSYMLLIVLLILSQDDCFNKSVHKKMLRNITWYGDRAIPSSSLGSMMVMTLVRTMHKNIQHLRDKFLHTNCLATLANMSAQIHSISPLAAEKLVILFKLLTKKYLRLTKSPEETSISIEPTTPTATPPTTPTTSAGPVDTVADIQTLEEILQTLLEVINSTLTHSLHTNPHLVYSLLYQREVFAPLMNTPLFKDLIQNIMTVVEYFSDVVDKKGSPPYSSVFVLQTIESASMSWPKNRLRLFPELRFRYVEEAQPEEFFIPYLWTLVHHHCSLRLAPSSRSTHS